MKDFFHPNIMPLIGVCLDAGTGISMVMPYMANGSLLDYVKKERTDISMDLTSNQNQVCKPDKNRFWISYISSCMQHVKVIATIINWFTDSASEEASSEDVPSNSSGNGVSCSAKVHTQRLGCSKLLVSCMSRIKYTKLLCILDLPLHVQTIRLCLWLWNFELAPALSYLGPAKVM